MSHPEGHPSSNVSARSAPILRPRLAIVAAAFVLLATPTAFSEPPPAHPPLLTLWPRPALPPVPIDFAERNDRPGVILPAASPTNRGSLDDDLPSDLPTDRPIPFELDEGIEEDGHIPKVDLPDDLAHPDRWRYIPEGLMPPGNILDRFLSTTFITPILSFEDDVGTGGGLHFADIDFAASRRQMVGSVALSYTTEGQQQYRASFRRFYHQRELPSGGIIQEERSWGGASGGYQKTLTRRFYGFGPNSDLDDETSYSEELWSAWVGEQRTFPHAGDDWVVRWGVGFESRDLDGGRVTGVPDTEVAFAGAFGSGDDLESLWISGGLRFDTRDSQHLPYDGETLGLDISWAPWMSNDADGAVITLSGSSVLPVRPLFHLGGIPDEEHPPIDTVALGFHVADSTGNLPFWALPSLGGNQSLRGFGSDRFIDRAAYHVAAEYRLWLLPRGFEVVAGSRVERFGMALFAEAGNVGPEVGELLDEDPHGNVGVGLRMTFERLALFRVDVGFSEEGSNLSIDFGLSF